MTTDKSVNEINIRCDGIGKLVIYTDRFGSAPCPDCGKIQLLHVNSKTTGRIPLHYKYF